MKSRGFWAGLGREEKVGELLAEIAEGKSEGKSSTRVDTHFARAVVVVLRMAEGENIVLPPGRVRRLGLDHRDRAVPPLPTGARAPSASMLVLPYQRGVL